MTFNSPDINTFKAELDNSISAVQKLKTDSHATIKIQSMLNISVYVSATRFLEGAVKHIIYNCCKMRGDTSPSLLTLENELKKFNNPEFSNIQSEISKHLGFNIIHGKVKGRFQDKDINLLNEIVKNRHRNVHASFDSSDWYSKNIKDIVDFQKEYVGLINILTYLDEIYYDSASASFKV